MLAFIIGNAACHTDTRKEILPCFCILVNLFVNMRESLQITVIVAQMQPGKLIRNTVFLRIPFIWTLLLESLEAVIKERYIDLHRMQREIYRH